jgi:type I restriction enzyme S subunit
MLLKDLLLETKDGEWGKDSPAAGLREMLVIRGADFDTVRLGGLDHVPVRFIPDRVADRKTLRADDILIETAGGTRGRPTGRTLFLRQSSLQVSKRPATCASFSRFLRPDPAKVLPEYLFWFLQFLYDDGRMDVFQVQHTGVARFQYTQFSISIDVPLPPRSVQSRIAEILGALDQKVGCNRRINELLLKMARALFQHRFAGGDDEVDAQPITDLVEVDPPIRIPKGKEVPYVDMRALPTDGISVSEVASRPAVSGSRFQNGDTLFARITPCLENGKTAFVDFLDDDEAGVGSTEFIVLRAKPGVSPQFVCCCARSPELRAHAIKSMVGTSGRQRVRPECFEHFLLKRFAPQTMREFHDQTLPWFQQIRANVKENQILARTRDYLLPKLLSGEVEVKAVDKAVEAIA